MLCCLFSCVRFVLFVLCGLFASFSVCFICLLLFVCWLGSGCKSLAPRGPQVSGCSMEICGEIRAQWHAICSEALSPTQIDHSFSPGFRGRRDQSVCFNKGVQYGQRMGSLSRLQASTLKHRGFCQSILPLSSIPGGSDSDMSGLFTSTADIPGVGKLGLHESRKIG